MTANFFSNKDPELPNLNLRALPKIKKGLPKLEMQGEKDLLFEIDGKSFLMDDVAEKFSNIYYNS